MSADAAHSSSRGRMASARTVEHVAVFTSPRAGSGAKREQIPRLLSMLGEAGVSAIAIHDPAGLSQWCQHRKELGQTPYSVVVPAGGDGTITLTASLLNPVASSTNNLALTEELVTDPFPMPLMVPMPLGTENLLARHYGHQADAAHVFDTIMRGRVDTMDMGVVTQCSSTNSETGDSLRAMKSHPMLTMTSCGFDAEVVRVLHLKRKGHIRRSSYFGPVLRSMRRYHFPELTVELMAADRTVLHEIRCGWAMVFNLPSYGGGLCIEPDAVGNDGQFNVITFKGRNLASGLGYVAGIKTGRHLHHPDVSRFEARNVRITSDQRVHYQIDGDYVGRLPIEVSLHPKAIKVLMPRGRIT